jgi:hypothetical protein
MAPESGSRCALAYCSTPESGRFASSTFLNPAWPIPGKSVCAVESPQKVFCTVIPQPALVRCCTSRYVVQQYGAWRRTWLLSRGHGPQTLPSSSLPASILGLLVAQMHGKTTTVRYGAVRYPSGPSSPRSCRVWLRHGDPMRPLWSHLSPSSLSVSRALCLPRSCSYICLSLPTLSWHFDLSLTLILPDRCCAVNWRSSVRPAYLPASPRRVAACP